MARSDTATIRARIPGWNEWRDIVVGVAVADDELVDLDRSIDRSEQQFTSYLLASLQMQNLLVLAGSGTSLCANGPSMSDLWNQCVDDDLPATKEVMDRVRYGERASERNIEELLSRCDALLQFEHDEVVATFRADSVQTILDLCRLPGSGSDGELKWHREFLRRLAKRRARDTRLRLFTSNYDLCFELAAGSLGLVTIDGMSFSTPRRFDPRFFDYDIVNRSNVTEGVSSFVSGVFRYYKLHGSVDWRLDGGTVVVDPSVEAADAALIYPEASKFQTSYRQPHLELMAQYLSALRQPNTCLVVLGFGFNDAHLSEPIHAALESNPHLRVVIVGPRVEAKIEKIGHGDAWNRFAEMAERGLDLAFVGSDFAGFVPLIPDLKALTPPERLAQAVVAIKD